MNLLNMSERHDLSTKKLVAIVVAAVVTSSVTTAFALLRVANSDHFTIIAQSNDIERLEANDANFVSRAELQQYVASLNKRLDDFGTAYTGLSSRIDQLLLSR